jgi:hypothetical protein
LNDSSGAVPRGLHRTGLQVALLLFVVLAPVVAVVLTRWGRPYAPLSDEATVAMRVRDVFTAHSPLVGAYSRGFNHPGPSFYWTLAPLSGLFGGASWTMPVGTALVQGVALTWLVLLARRRGGIAFALGASLMVGLAYVGMDVHDAFLRAWNPYVAFPVFLLFLLIAWSFADGEVQQLPWLLLTGSFVVQCHIGYAPLVLAALAWASTTAWLGRRAAASAATVRRRPLVLWSAAVLGVMWLPAVVDQLTADHGNLGAIRQYFTHQSSVLGLRDGAGLFAAEFRVVPPWLGGSSAYRFGTSAVVPASPAWLLVPLLLLALGGWAARRSGRRSDQHLIELAAVLAVLAIVTLSRISVDPVAFLFFWRTSVAVFLVFACAVAVVHAFPELAHRVRRPALVLVAAGVVLLSASAVSDVLDRRDRLGPNEDEFTALLGQIRHRGLPHRAFLVRAVGDPASGFDQGLVDALDEAGVPVRVDRELGYQFGSERGAAVSDVDEVWLVTEGGVSRERMLALPGARLVASVSPLSPSDERELSRLQRGALATMAVSGHDGNAALLDNELFAVVDSRDPHSVVAPADAARISELAGKAARAQGCRCAVVAVPASEAPPFAPR